MLKRLRRSWLRSALLAVVLVIALRTISLTVQTEKHCREGKTGKSLRMAAAMRRLLRFLDFRMLISWFVRFVFCVLPCDRTALCFGKTGDDDVSAVTVCSESKQGTRHAPCAGFRQLPFCGVSIREHLALQRSQRQA